MTKPKKTTQDFDVAVAEMAAQLVQDAMLHALRQPEASFDAVFAGSISQIATEVASHAGGHAAARMLEGAAEAVRNLPSAQAYALAFAEPKGSA